MTLLLLLDESETPGSPPTIVYTPDGGALGATSSFDITITTVEGVEDVFLWAEFTNGSTEIIYNGLSFGAEYSSGSSISGTSTNQTFTLARSPYWSQSFTVHGYITDGISNKVLTSKDFTVGVAPTATPPAINPDDVYALAKITDHDLDRQLYIQIFQEEYAPRLNKLMDTLSAQTQDLENEMWDMLTIRTIALATGQFLDDIGLLFGLPRHGLDDTTYRQYIGAQIASLRSSGRHTDLYAVARTLLTSLDSELTSKDYYPHTARFIVSGSDGLDGVDPTTMFFFLRQAKSAGVRLLMEWWPCAENGMFQFSSTSAVETDTATGFSDENQIDGGCFAGAKGA